MNIWMRLLAIGAFLVLGAAAVWMGGLNQDEGWYLYAANLVAEGKLPYRDFFFTQGPVMPIVYSALTGVWKSFGLLGARAVTLLLGFASIALAAAVARELAPTERKREAAWIVFMLLGCNLYHLYYLAIPKTYALAALLVTLGFYLLVRRHWALAAMALALAVGTRLSLMMLPLTAGVALIVRRQWRAAAWFAAGTLLVAALLLAPCCFDERFFSGLLAAQRYHAAREGFELTWTVGSLSRLVRWYLPVLVVLGLGARVKTDARAFLNLLVLAFLAVFLLQWLAPFPYEDYQVPVMALLAVVAAVRLSVARGAWLTMALTFACSFGSPLLEQWSVDGQDRFWTQKKECFELAQLQQAAAKIEALDPGGKTLLTQDLYLAVETGRKVPEGLEMGPFAMLSDAEWRRLLETVDCPVAALSGYTFAIEPPECGERSLPVQLEYWELLKRNYTLADRIARFGQNHTSLLLLKRK